MILMDSFMTWIGGKKSLRNEIVSRFPDDKSDKYVEVFGGAGWVLFHKEKYAPKEIYNDINSNLVNLFRMMKYHPEAVEKELAFDLNARELHKLYKQNVDNEDLTEIQKAARFLYLIKASYGAKLSSYGTNFCDISHIKNYKKIFNMISKKRNYFFVYIEKKLFEIVLKINRSIERFIFCHHFATNGKVFFEFYKI